MSAAIDFLALGALVHRIDSGIVPFQKATRCAVHVSGGEFNCAANLAECFRLNTAIATAMVEYPVGQLTAERVRAAGVTPFYRYFAHDGVTGPNIAAVYSDRGYGARPPVVFYNRSNEAAALLKPGDFDWRTIFGAGVRWFHSGGIFASLSDSTAELVREAMQAAKAHGVVTSFNLNYRDKLWKARGGPGRAQAVLASIVRHVDVLVGNEEDLQHALGMSGPDAGAARAGDADPFFSMIDRAVSAYPQLAVVATSLRYMYSASRHQWGAAAWIRGDRYVTPFADIDVFDRVGSGDGFASGLFYGLLTQAPPEQCLRLGWAHGALLATTPGDTTMATLDQVRNFAREGSSRIQR